MSEGVLFKAWRGISFVISVRLPAHPHAPQQNPSNGFSWNLVFLNFNKMGANVTSQAFLVLKKKCEMTFGSLSVYFLYQNRRKDLLYNTNRRFWSLTIIGFRNLERLCFMWDKIWGWRNSFKRGVLTFNKCHLQILLHGLSRCLSLANQLPRYREIIWCVLKYKVFFNGGK